MVETKKLEDLLKSLNGSFGENAVIRVGDASITKIKRNPTGVFSFDNALGGGFPEGRIIELYGPESSGKTTMALLSIAEAQKAGKLCAFVDVEQALDFEYAKILGVNMEDLVVSQPECGEDALEILDRLIESAMFSVIVFDSVAAIVPRAELEGEMGDQKMGVVARLMSQAMRKITAKTNKTHTTVIFINQLREKIGIVYGNPSVTTGGKALAYFSSQRIEVTKGSPIKKGDDVVGYPMKIKVVKNKVSAPFKTASVDNMFGIGLDILKDKISVAAELDVIQKSGSWYAYGDTKLGQGLDKVKTIIEDNPEMWEEIEEKVKQILIK